jgi:hypothetical protein
MTSPDPVHASWRGVVQRSRTVIAMENGPDQSEWKRIETPPTFKARIRGGEADVETYLMPDGGTFHVIRPRPTSP